MKKTEFITSCEKQLGDVISVENLSSDIIASMDVIYNKDKTVKVIAFSSIIVPHVVKVGRSPEEMREIGDITPEKAIEHITEWFKV